MAKQDSTTGTTVERSRKSAAEKAQAELDKVVKQRQTVEKRRNKAVEQVSKAQEQVTKLDNELAAVEAQHDYVSRNPSLPAVQPLYEDTPAA